MTEDMQKSHKALGKVLTILQEKGGCGKSSAIFNVSYYLSQNYKVLVIDLDGQAADITYYFFGNTIAVSYTHLIPYAARARWI